MARRRRILILALVSFVTLFFPSRPSPYANTQSPTTPPTLLAMSDNPGAGGAVAISTDGGIWLGHSRVWTRIGTTPSVPADIWTRPSTGEIFIAMANGDVFRLESDQTMTFDSNVFAGVTAVTPTPPQAANQLAPNRPNPFNPATRIPYTLASGGRVTIRVYDIAGRLVRTVTDEEKPRGAYAAAWGGETDRGSRAGSGTYILRITYPDGTSAEQKLTVLK